MAEALKRSQITTEDGTVIIFDPALGEAVSGRTQADAEAEIARRKASSRPAGAGQIDDVDLRREGQRATPRESRGRKVAAR